MARRERGRASDTSRRISRPSTPDSIVGIFPIVRVKSQLFGNIACSLPFVNYGGPCGETDAIEQALVDAAKPIVDAWGVDYLEIRSRRQLEQPADVRAQGEHDAGSESGSRGPVQGVHVRAPSGHSWRLQEGTDRARSAGASCSAISTRCCPRAGATWARRSTRGAISRRLRRRFPDITRLCVVYAGNEPAAASLDMLAGDTAEGLWLGSRAKFRRQHAGYVLYWELIKNACERGLKRFHLGRSTTQSGGEVFKKKWNAYPIQLYWQYMLRTRRDIPQLNVANPKYQFAIRTWQKLPVPVTQVIGPLIARSIP